MANDDDITFKTVYNFEQFSLDDGTVNIYEAAILENLLEFDAADSTRYYSDWKNQKLDWEIRLSRVKQSDIDAFARAVGLNNDDKKDLKKLLKDLNIKL